MKEVVVGVIVVEALNLVAIVSREEFEDLVEEVLYFDDGLIGEGRQVDRDGGRAWIGAHGC